jgi:hemoglobin-like flavoprotein
MTPQQISLVTSTWQNVIPIRETAAGLFYGKLFELDPSLQTLFKGDMKEQGRKLMSMLNTAVVSLSSLERLLPVVQELGRRHAKYGIRHKDYDTVAGALLWTLAEGLGPAFTDEAKQAWIATYTVLATTMKNAAAEPLA